MKAYACALLLVTLSSSAFSQKAVLHRELSVPGKHDVSAPLRDIIPLRPAQGKFVRHLGGTPTAAPTTVAADPVLQTSAALSPNLVPGVNFDGVGTSTGYLTLGVPPDPNIAVGDSQVVQWVNLAFAVYNKTGTKLYGPAAGNTLWSGFGGPCESSNDGDPIVQYDKLAKRWVMTQFAVLQGAPFYQCIAVSQTSDALGRYNRYAYSTSTAFPDYPKLGVWPDAYYMSFNLFLGFTNISFGPAVCAFNRAAMLQGQPAGAVCFLLNSTVDGVLPADVDGNIPPPAGLPNFYVGFRTNALLLWYLHVDWTNTSKSVLAGPSVIPTAAFTPTCAETGCVPQLGTAQTLDAIGDRVMYRFSYRNFANAAQPYHSFLVNHSVATPSGNIGVRWYELRDTVNGIYQQGTYAPDTNYRWMGSIAQDKMGDIAVGYSVSSASMYPSIAYAGRVPSDPLGTLGAETVVVSGTGAQQLLNRWGDYSAMSVDPVDDCTMWYTNEYLTTTGAFNWSTRIASFRFANCQ